MTFYFYDLETSGINSKAQRIMQFAGQRTDEDFNLIGEPQNWLVKLTDEILPDPDAILITGITPQKTLEEGYSEVEFLKLFKEQVLQPDTVIVGFNNIRFDDEFMRQTLWRNFYDAYEWQYQDGRTRWDMLDVTRMVRALRPEGVEWPFEKRPAYGSDHGQPKDTAELVEVPSNRLELLTKANNLDHENAHDALSDVTATINVAKLIKQKQPKIFDFLFSIREKKKIIEMLEEGNPFVYTSGRFGNSSLKTTVVLPIAKLEQSAWLVYDLRQNPDKLAELSDEELKEAAFSRADDSEIITIKTLKANKCPAIAPLGVLDAAAQARLDLSIEEIIKPNLAKLAKQKDLVARLVKLHEEREAAWRDGFSKNQSNDPDLQLYDGFLNDGDRSGQSVVRAASSDEITKLDISFTDKRLQKLLPRYKARNFEKNLSSSEREAWDEYRKNRIVSGINGQLSLEAYLARISELSTVKTDEGSQFLLQELQLYAENILPYQD